MQIRKCISPQIRLRLKKSTSQIMKFIRIFLKRQLFLKIIQNKLSHLLRSTAERWIKFNQQSSYLSEIIVKYLLSKPVNFMPQQITLLSKVSVKLKSFFGQSSPNFWFFPSSVRIVSLLSPALNSPQILGIIDPPDKKDL